MAPTSNSAKAVQQNRPRPAVPKAIVPAIPLPYIQKRKQQVAAREKAKEEASTPPLVETPSSQTPPATDIIPATANDSPGSHIIQKEEEAIGSSSPGIPALEDALLEAAVEEREISVQEESFGKHATSLSCRIHGMYLT